MFEKIGMSSWGKSARPIVHTTRGWIDVDRSPFSPYVVFTKRNKRKYVQTIGVGWVDAIHRSLWCNVLTCSQKQNYVATLMFIWYMIITCRYIIDMYIYARDALSYPIRDGGSTQSHILYIFRLDLNVVAINIKSPYLGSIYHSVGPDVHKCSIIKRI